MRARTIGFVRLIEQRTVFDTAPRVAESVQRTDVADVSHVVPRVPRRTPRKTLRPQKVQHCGSATREQTLCAFGGSRLTAAARRVTQRT